MRWRYRALLIGNWHFPADPTNLPDLNGPIQDVAGLAAALVDSKTGLFHESDVEVVTERTATEIAVASEHFFYTASRNELVFLYYSGHGLTNDQGNELLLCGRDSRTDRPVATTVSSRQINSMIDSSAAIATVIVLDCCHSGAFKGADVSRPFAGDGRYILSSCRAAQLAPDAKNPTRASRFTSHLIQGLLGEAAIGRDAESVTLIDLYQHVYRCMRTDDGPIPQQSFSGRGDIPIARLGGREGNSPSMMRDPEEAPEELPTKSTSDKRPMWNSDPDDFVLSVDTLRQRQLVRMEDLPLTIEGRYTGRSRPVRVILQDSQGNNYLQNPEVRFLPDGTWFASNILPGEGIELVNFVAVGTAGRAHFDKMVEHRAFGAFGKLPSDAFLLASVRITRVP